MPGILLLWELAHGTGGQVPNAACAGSVHGCRSLYHFPYGWEVRLLRPTTWGQGQIYVAGF